MLYRRIICTFKKIDKATNYKFGNIIRRITNINTKKYWDKKLFTKGNFWRDFPYKFLLKFLPKNEKFSLLDIGCALGDGCILLKKYFPKAEISGADFSRVGIEKAKKKTNQVSFFVLDILKQNPPKKYDYITLVSTLEHFNEPYYIVEKCLKFVDKALFVISPYTREFTEPRLYGVSQHRYLFNENSFLKYHSQILRITEKVEFTGYRYIIYKIIPHSLASR